MPKTEDGWTETAFQVYIVDINNIAIVQLIIMHSIIMLYTVIC